MRRGQTTVEYMILISVISIAIVAIMLPFQTLVVDNVSDVSDDMASGSSGTLISAGVQP
ncbi:MAG: hypothetical protein VX519_01465 [Myxococcota bacterium]|nr:hypothetical protein [Myxococcota bacterium]